MARVLFERPGSVFGCIWELRLNDINIRSDGGCGALCSDFRADVPCAIADPKEDLLGSLFNLLYFGRKTTYSLHQGILQLTIVPRIRIDLLLLQ